jgi:hypothetical protein
MAVQDDANTKPFLGRSRECSFEAHATVRRPLGRVPRVARSAS